MVDRATTGGRERIRVLMVEDQPDDADLVLLALRGDALDPDYICVDNERDFLRSLSDPYDVVLSDYTVPSFGALRALEIVRERSVDIPFIVVTGSISEEVAVECMKRGASDYLLKDRLARLGSAVRQALRERRLRLENARKEEQLRWEQEALRRAQKMEAIGRLAGGIAHDFNNVLTAILGFSDLLDATVVDPQSRRFVGEVREAALRAADLTGQLLAFSRRQVLKPTVLDLNEVVDGLFGLLERVIGEDVVLRKVLDPALGRVKADRGQIEQVLMNLVVNARDALPRGGNIVISTQNESVPDRGREGDARVTLSVRDDGTGMDEETQSRIFEPFFTTKPLGKGTGLGLSTVDGIMAQSGGRIEVASAPGKGTTFLVSFPATSEPMTFATPVPKPTVPESGSGTILLAEDEVAVRRLLRQILSEHGYTVLEAADGISALEMACRESGPIDLLVTDMIMPGMNGRELCDRLGGVHPETRVLIMSGYVEHVALEDEEAFPPELLIQKPFTRSELLERVVQALRQ